MDVDSFGKTRCQECSAVYKPSDGHTCKGSLRETHEGPQSYNCPACPEYSERAPCVSCGNGGYEEFWVPDCGAANVCHSVVVEMQSRLKEIEDNLFRMKRIGDRLFMHANKLAIKDRTPELDDAVMDWAGVHKGEY